MPGAKVTVKNEGTNVVEEDDTTNDAGFFSYPTLLPGTYTLTVSAKGFATWETHSLVLNLKDSRTMNIDMAVATTTEQVTVVSNAELIAPVDSGGKRNDAESGDGEQHRHPGTRRRGVDQVHAGHGDEQRSGSNNVEQLDHSEHTGPVGQFSANGTQPYGGLQLTVDGGLLVDNGNMGRKSPTLTRIRRPK